MGGSEGDMITEPRFVGTPTYRNYEDYKYGKAWADGWNDAMEFVFQTEIESERVKQMRSNFKLISSAERL